MQIIARQNSVAAPTRDATTAIIARERRRNTALNSILKNMPVLVIGFLLPSYVGKLSGHGAPPRA